MANWITADPSVDFLLHILQRSVYDKAQTSAGLKRKRKAGIHEMAKDHGHYGFFVFSENGKVFVICEENAAFANNQRYHKLITDDGFLLSDCKGPFGVYTKKSSSPDSDRKDIMQKLENARLF
ncbi:hypothetical protein GF382_00645 [Candidatus Falkowbacteria bacterium]|nr:hypothetical protein [Candidatus Falkowbacteria bacterium]